MSQNKPKVHGTWPFCALITAPFSRAITRSRNNARENEVMEQMVIGKRHVLCNRAEVTAEVAELAMRAELDLVKDVHASMPKLQHLNTAIKNT